MCHGFRRTTFVSHFPYVSASIQPRIVRFVQRKDGEGNNKVCLRLLHMQAVNAGTDTELDALDPPKERTTLSTVHCSSRLHRWSRRTLSRRVRARLVTIV